MPLGVEDGRVPDPLMRASSFYNYYCGPFNARLNRRRYGRQGGAWCAKRRDRRQWLQIDFGALTKVCRVATQGRQNSAQWVTSYYITHSRNEYKFIPYREGRRTKVWMNVYLYTAHITYRLMVVYNSYWVRSNVSFSLVHLPFVINVATINLSMVFPYFIFKAEESHLMLNSFEKYADLRSKLVVHNKSCW